MCGEEGTGRSTWARASSCSVPVKGGRPRQQRVDHHADGVQIRSPVHMIPQEALGGHVRGRAGQLVAAAHPRELGEPEVEHLHAAALGQDHVGALHVVVHDVQVVSRLQSVQHLQRDAHRLARRQPPSRSAVPEVGEVGAHDQLHHEVLDGAVAPVGVHPCHGGVSEAHRGQRLSAQIERGRALLGAGVLQGQHLDRDDLIQEQIVGAEDHSQPTLTDHRVETVPIGQDVSDARLVDTHLVRHTTPPQIANPAEHLDLQMPGTPT